jgi:hypothetical protein
MLHPATVIIQDEGKLKMDTLYAMRGMHLGVTNRCRKLLIAKGVR